jgi:hypothetical protein
MTPRALTAILQARLRAERRTILYACAAALVLGFVQPRGAAGLIFLCSLFGIVMALAQDPGRYPHLDRSEQSAPLFGRELARAKALVPCIAAILAICGYSAARLIAGAGDAGVTFVAATAAVVATTLVALSATIRTGPSRALYVVLAGSAGACAYFLAIVGGSIPGELAFCAVVSFLALRQYGEALARYDPI